MCQPCSTLNTYIKLHGYMSKGWSFLALNEGLYYSSLQKLKKKKPQK